MVANAADRAAIYRLRHEIYALELNQHRPNEAESLRDALDETNTYIVAKQRGEIAGFVSVTPPDANQFSIDKYFDRAELPVAINDGTYEVRLLTVSKCFRAREFATLLMYAAFRWVEAHGGRRIVAIGRREVVSMYVRAGLRRSGRVVHSGAVEFEFLHATVEQLRENLPNFGGLLARLREDVDWKFSYPFDRPPACFHGGAFFKAIGERFEDLSRKEATINADVLDAWFPPAPAVTRSLTEELPWLLRTSPPTDCCGLIEAISEARGVLRQNILPGAGSSDLMFRALRHWLTPESRVLILDPTYGEYAHILERVIGCMVDRLTLARSEGFELKAERLVTALKDNYDLVVLVNPNSPTGRFLPQDAMKTILATAPAATRFWVDETYIDYVNSAESIERLAVRSENVVVCKSMSKGYALSGARAAYLCAGAHQLESLRAITPPWVVGLPTQLAAVRALESLDYYRERWAETHSLRGQLADGLMKLGWDVLPGCANFLLCELPGPQPSAAELVRRCREQGLFIRDAALMGARLGGRFVRIAVKDSATNEKMLAILREAVGGV
jgi:histidinol-phosphate/aromatic aminotransferase/cobyric acid decarboxylase-like protein/N-acyl-L-homoserine lactone synthetase